MDIRCRKTSCVYNEGQTCKAKEILVNRRIICSTFEQGQEQGEDLSKSIFEKTPVFAKQRDVKTMKIYCKTDWIFNDDGICTANGITVNDLIEPYCITYLKK